MLIILAWILRAAGLLVAFFTWSDALWTGSALPPRAWFLFLLLLLPALPVRIWASRAWSRGLVLFLAAVLSGISALTAFRMFHHGGRADFPLAVGWTLEAGQFFALWVLSGQAQLRAALHAVAQDLGFQRADRGYGLRGRYRSRLVWVHARETTARVEAELFDNSLGPIRLERRRFVFSDTEFDRIYAMEGADEARDRLLTPEVKDQLGHAGRSVIVRGSLVTLDGVSPISRDLIRCWVETVVLIAETIEGKARTGTKEER